MEFSQNFKNWFGSSKVIDSNGNPLRVYHGTNQSFDNFNGNRMGGSTQNSAARMGFWFADHPTVASEYADLAAKHVIHNVEEHEKEYKRLSREIEKAERRGDWDTQERLTIELEKHEISALREEPKGMNVMPVYLHIINPKVIEVNGSFFNIKDSQGKWIPVGDIIQTAKKEGHDGVIFKDVEDTPGDSHTICDHFVVFNPNQVKSAIGNKGTYNKEDERITESISNKYPKILSDGYAIAEYINSISKSYIDVEMVSEYFRGAKAILKYISINDIKEGDSDHNIVNAHKEKKYYRLSLETMPPIVIENGEIQDGNHRYRVAKAKGAKKIWCYDVINTDKITESEELFTFITESKMIRNDQTASKFDINELSEILFAMLLTLHLLGPTNEVKRYCINSLQFPKFDHIFLSSTDLANVISTLRNAKEYLQKPNIDIPVIELKRYLRGTISGNNIASFSRAFFFKMQTRLKIKDANLLILRREIVDSDSIRNKTRLGDQLYQYLRKYNNCDLLVILQILMDES